MCLDDVRCNWISRLSHSTPHLSHLDIGERIAGAQWMHLDLALCGTVIPVAVDQPFGEGALVGEGRNQTVWVHITILF
jgi:hypothetical protein